MKICEIIDKEGSSHYYELGNWEQIKGTNYWGHRCPVCDGDGKARFPNKYKYRLAGHASNRDDNTQFSKTAPCIKCNGAGYLNVVSGDQKKPEPAPKNPETHKKGNIEKFKVEYKKQYDQLLKYFHKYNNNPDTNDKKTLGLVKLYNKLLSDGFLPDEDIKLINNTLKSDVYANLSAEQRRRIDKSDNKKAGKTDYDYRVGHHRDLTNKSTSTDPHTFR